MQLNSYLYIASAVVYASLTVFIAVRGQRRPTAYLAICCGLIAVWSACGAVLDPALTGFAGMLDIGRMLVWYIYILILYQRSGVAAKGQVVAFTAVAVGAAALTALTIWPGRMGGAEYSLLSLPIMLRLALAVCELLLIENLFLNLPDYERWHVALPCSALGGLAFLDIIIAADTVLFHRDSVSLAGSRAIVMMLIAPFLALAASRGQRWTKPVRLSRAVVFHSATLVLSGSVLLAIAIAGEIFRRFNKEWGWIAEVSLVFAGLIGLLLFLTSRSARSLMHRVVVLHFFASRYDYRQQWLKCIATLSGLGTNERTALHTRAIRAVADTVDSPNGALFLRDGPSGTLSWAGSWNMPAGSVLAEDNPIVAALRDGEAVINQRELQRATVGTSLEQLGTLWLAVPLVHTAGVIGVVILGPPRVSFDIDVEVTDLLKIIGREVATYVAEQRATEVMLQTRNLHDYGKRFAFVAHDIKNVSSQLALLLRNAEHHLGNPEFQQDMLETVRASVQKIDGLLKRLEEPARATAPAAIAPGPRLEGLVATYQRVRKARITLEHDGSTGQVAIGTDAFEAAITHLLNNAVEAAPGLPVLIRLRHEATRVVVEIVDRGPGMTPEFVRDHLFRPFDTAKAGGSGIGTFQARELVREAGGELIVASQPGMGTTMRVILARADLSAGQSIEKRAALSVAGE